MISIIKIPFDKCIVEQKRRGAAFGPNQIEKDLKDIFSFEEKSKNFKFLEAKEVDDFEKLHKEIEALANKEYKAKNFVIGLGGDHSVSYGLMKAFAKNHKNAGLIYFDAHLDCQDDFLPPTHEDVLRAAVKEKLFSRIIVVGARNYTQKEFDFARKEKIKIVDSKVQLLKIIELCKRLDSIYMSIDIDVIDPAFAPGTGWPEPIGLLPHEFMEILRKIKLTGKLKGADIVEVSPPKDTNNITSKLAAKIVVSLNL